MLTWTRAFSDSPFLISGHEVVDFGGSKESGKAYRNRRMGHRRTACVGPGNEGGVRPVKALQRERQQLCLQERQQQQRSLHQQRSLVLQRRRQPPSGGPLTGTARAQSLM